MSDVGKEEPHEVTRIEQLQELLGDLLSRINGDQRLALAAATNPLLALEELGVRLAPEVRREIESRGRFSRRQLARREKLLDEFTQVVPGYAIKEADLLSARELRRLLRDFLKIEPGRIPADLDVRWTRAAANSKAAYSKKAADPLDAVADAHPTIPALIALRAIERKAMRFASPSIYRAIRLGELKLPILAISGHPAAARDPGEASARKLDRGSKADG